jgi:hypothetical protein
VRSRNIRSNRPRAGAIDDDQSGSRLFVLRALGWSARDAVGVVVGGVATVAILVNVLFLQSGPHPAPIFKSGLIPVASGETTSAVVSALPRARPADAAAGKSDTRASGENVKPTKTVTAAVPAPRPAPARPDPIAEVLAPSKRVLAMQRALAEYGYGQIKPTGVVDADTRAAIEKFERERKLPITGQASDRVARELTAITGRPFD